MQIKYLTNWAVRLLLVSLLHANGSRIQITFNDLERLSGVILAKMDNALCELVDQKYVKIVDRHGNNDITLEILVGKADADYKAEYLSQGLINHLGVVSRMADYTQPTRPQG